jgi:hypothetical protein
VPADLSARQLLLDPASSGVGIETTLLRRSRKFLVDSSKPGRARLSLSQSIFTHETTG